MLSRGSLIRLLAGGLLVVVLLPAAAYAGKTVISGHESLRVKDTLTPVGAAGVTLRLVWHDLSTKPGGPQPPYIDKSIAFAAPPGLDVNASSIPACRQSAVAKSKTGAAVCPAAAKVGTGTATLNSRPFVPSLISAKITAYNGVDDVGGGGYRRGSRELILEVKASAGFIYLDPFHVVTSGGTVRFVSDNPKPPSPVSPPGAFTVQKLDLTLSGPATTPYLVQTAACSGSWAFSLTITNWFGGPTISAGDQVSCGHMWGWPRGGTL